MILLEVDAIFTGFYLVSRLSNMNGRTTRGPLLYSRTASAARVICGQRRADRGSRCRTDPRGPREIPAHRM